LSNSDVVLLSEDAPIIDILRALVAKGEGKTVKVVRKGKV
jgi:hypothetical protein